jgi:hypothetical protein
LVGLRLGSLCLCAGRLAAIADQPVRIYLEATAAQTGQKLKLLCNQSEATLQLVSAHLAVDANRNQAVEFNGSDATSAANGLGHVI